jgi:hypothetical protein
MTSATSRCSPSRWAEWCAGEFARIADFSARHERPHNTGWTDIYVRQPAPLQIAALKIPLEPAVAALRLHLPQFEAVLTGNFDAPQPAARAQAFGRSPLAAILIMADETSQHIEWFELILRGRGHDAAALFPALAAVPAPEPLMVVDWTRARSVRVASASEVATYLTRSR